MYQGCPGKIRCSLNIWMSTHSSFKSNGEIAELDVKGSSKSEDVMDG